MTIGRPGARSLPKRKTTRVIAVTESQVAAFRLARHHLLRPSTSDPVAVCRDICGVQAQLMAAARLNLAARTRGLTPAMIDSALWEKRSLVKALSMRQTVHLLPASEFHIYAAAVRRSRVAAVVRIMDRFRITADDRRRLLDAILDPLDAGPLSNSELDTLVRPRVSTRVRAWMDRVWNSNRLALVAGLICYGPNRGQQVTYVRVDRWLPRHAPISDEEAQCRLLAGFLRAYGPATLADFSKWSGISVAEARGPWQSLAGELAEVSVSGRSAWLLRKDAAALRGAAFDGPAVNLLAAFDSFLLAHAQKDHLIAPRHYKRVYRSLGMISPVVLVRGTVAATWTHETRKSRIEISIRPFAPLARASREGIEREAEALGKFLGATPAVRFSGS